jgi:hypothetical protein
MARRRRRWKNGGGKSTLAKAALVAGELGRTTYGGGRNPITARDGRCGNRLSEVPYARSAGEGDPPAAGDAGERWRAMADGGGALAAARKEERKGMECE